ncbi:hypothetical protein KKI23_03670 [Patescibacteria group bacterium]|nr:hypothetical protein [Patescibacteria group bacterium]
MNKKVIIAACLLVVLVVALGVKIMVTEARFVDCTWTQIKLCYDDNPDNDDPRCCGDGTPKDEMNFPG